MVKLECEHCEGVALKRLTDLEKKGRKNVFQCPKCKCIYSLGLVRSDPKCFEKRTGASRRHAKKEKERKHTKKRNVGRPRKR